MPVNKPINGRNAAPAVDSTDVLGIGDAITPAHLQFQPRARRKSHNWGKLEYLFNMPMDIFYEIGGHLMPRDILSLSRTSKRLREILLSRTARHVWIAARSNVMPPLPACPLSISEADYAHILFDKKLCEACGAPRPTYSLFAIPARLCSLCFSANIVTGAESVKRYGLRENGVKLLYLLPPIPRGFDVKVRSSVVQTPEQYYYAPDFAAILWRFRGFAAKGEKEGWKQYVEKLRKSVLPKMNFHAAVLQWEENVRDTRLEKYRDLRAARVSAISAKLAELGVQPDEFAYSAEWTRLVRRPAELTDKNWDKIRPELLRMVEERREELRERQRLSEFNERRGRLLNMLRKCYEDVVQGVEDLPQGSEPLIFPPWHEATERVASLNSILQDTRDVSEMTQAQLQSLGPKILADVRRINLDIKQYLLDLISTTTTLDAPPNGSKGRKGKNSIKNTAPAVERTKGRIFDILDSVSAMFVCGRAYPSMKKTDCRLIYSFRGLVDHWQDEHGDLPPSTGTYITVAGDARQPRNIARLLTALGLPEEATMTAVEERVRSGRVRCSCGVDCTREAGRKRPHLMLSRVIEHVLDPLAHPAPSLPPQLNVKAFPVRN
ncbi:hypothetical protein C8Q77DRAFT_1097365 [Trametes polyzona]|nr:hypothetical protein C8Q77DRAFT_1097365 [Trametes polyzona]